MRIIVRADRRSAPGVVHQARARLAFAMGRFHTRIRSVSMRLSGVEGPSGGADTRCLITLRFDAPTERLIVIEDTDPVPAAAVDRAVGRAARTVARALQTLTDSPLVRS